MIVYISEGARLGGDLGTFLWRSIKWIQEKNRQYFLGKYYNFTEELTKLKFTEEMTKNASLLMFQKINLAT